MEKPDTLDSNCFVLRHFYRNPIPASSSGFSPALILFKTAAVLFCMGKVLAIKKHCALIVLTLKS